MRLAGYSIVEDEIGRPGLVLADVKLWREHERRAEAADVARQAAFTEHQAATRAWVKGREEAAWAANRRASAAARGSRIMATSAGKEAGTRAAEDYERSTPRPTFDGRPGTTLAFIDEAEAAGTLARVKSRARRLVGLEESVR